MPPLRIYPIYDLQIFKAHLCDSVVHGIIDIAEFQSLKDYYDDKTTCLSVEITALQKKLLNIDNALIWVDNFMQFCDLKELDRLAVVRMIKNIRVINKKEISIDFVCLHEYEQIIRYMVLGGYCCGEKEPQTK